jgi:hypothetical protein
MNEKNTTFTPEELEAAVAARRRYKQEWRERNRERIRRYNRQWARDNREKVRLSQMRYWAKKAAEQMEATQSQ